MPEQQLSMRRMFTRRDDEMILAVSRGEMSLKNLRKILRVGRAAVERRADELGVCIFFGQRRPQQQKERPPPPDETIRIIDDKYLMRLYEVYGARNHGD
jgi:hypothetical protein